MSRLFRKLEKWLAPSWALVILVACIVPTDDISIDSNILVPHADKIAHFVMYFIFQVLFMSHNLKFGKRYSTWIIFILTASYGFLIECIQGYFLMSRFFENYDIIANITGAFMGILFFNRIKS